MNIRLNNCRRCNKLPNIKTTEIYDYEIRISYSCICYLQPELTPEERAIKKWNELNPPSN